MATTGATPGSFTACSHDGAEMEDGFVAIERVKQMLGSGSHSLVVFLDYDGTLSPIVTDPKAAFLPEKTKVTLQRLAGLVPTVVISGRAKETVRNFVQIDDIIYAGSHGFKLDGTAQFQHDLEVGLDHKDILTAGFSRLEKAVADVCGARLEWNDLCFTVHYRCVGEGEQESVINRVRKIVEEEFCVGKWEGGTPGKAVGLEVRGGKMVLEVRPSIDWNKGMCVSWVLEKMDAALKKENKMSISLYIGDDVTDEDAFQELKCKYGGLSFGILVAKDGGKGLGRKTNANFVLDSPVAVESFLAALADTL
eukprot:g6696.t1